MNEDRRVQSQTFKMDELEEAYDKASPEKSNSRRRTDARNKNKI